ncbi:MAG: SPOR domain-containing protein [Candidatus Neomarinimicrobiota bacterium]|nr:SPOR domain-containing protein [Candidatus Neomarinimicrobiota bacterium]
MKRLIVFFFVNISIICAQNINLYLTLIQKGRYEEVMENLPDLLSRYPNDPGVYYIQALINKDGDSSLSQYQNLIDNYPDSDYASMSSMKIGEYLFARGLYSQASIHLKRTIFDFPKGDNHQRAMDLMINSYIATGEEDSAKVSLRLINSLYPSLSYNKYGLDYGESNERDPKLVRLDRNTISERINIVKARRAKSKTKKQVSKPWVIQVGAFGKYTNANRLKKQLQNSGYKTEVHKINSNGKRLHAVRIERYQSKTDAEKIGRSLKSKFGLDFRVINSPK